MSTLLDAAELAALRRQFPALDVEVNGHPLVYLDSGATAHKPLAVLDAEREYLVARNSAVHRGAHTLAAEATEEFEAARETIAAFVGGAPDELVWTSNATAALNLLSYALSNPGGGIRPVGPGDEILVTELEHHANLIPWQQLALRSGATLRFLPVDDDGRLELERLGDLVTERTRVVAVAHVSNVLGVVHPLAELIAAAHAVGALVVLDACQSAAHLPLDLPALGVDAAVFSGHKLLGPTGVGALWARRDLLASLPPVTTGGSMITTVTMERAEFLPPPQRFEAGTQPVSQAIGFAAAVRFLGDVGMPRVAAHANALGARLVSGLSAIRGVRVLGAELDAPRVGLAAFDLDGVHAHDVGQFLDDRGIAVRVGHHCAQPLHRRLGLTASVRASTALYSTEQEVDTFLTAVEDAREFFRVGR